MADASVLGTDWATSAGSSPVSPTLERNLTVEATNTVKIFVAQDVALKTKCCNVEKGSVVNSSF